MTNDPTTPDETVPAVIITAPEGHHIHGPSSLKHKDINRGGCAHYRGNKSTNPMAEEGSMLHDRLALWLITNDEVRANEGLSEEQARLLWVVYNFFRQEIASLCELSTDELTVLVERRVNVAELTWGTADLIVLNQRTRKGKILDAKFGFIPVDDAEDNLQGRAYAVGVMYEFPKLTEIEVIFAQPRCDEISRGLFKRTQYAALVKEISDVVVAAEDSSAPYNPNPSNCQYCGNLGACPSMLQLATTVARHVQQDVKAFEIPAELSPENITDPTMMAQAMVIAEALGDWVAAVKDRTKQMMVEEGQDIPGYELARRKAPRKITNTQMAWEVTKDTLSAEDFLACVDGVKITELEKAFAEKAPRGVKGKSRQVLEDRLMEVDALKQEGEVVFPRRVKVKAKALAETATN